MTWEEKLAACQALSECSLKMRSPGNWYVQQCGTDITQGSMLVGKYGNGQTPQQAVEDHWLKLTELAPQEYIVIRAYGEDRLAVKWNGYMWSTVNEILK